MQAFFSQHRLLSSEHGVVLNHFPKLRLKWCLAGPFLELTVKIAQNVLSCFGQSMSRTNQTVNKLDQDADLI